MDLIEAVREYLAYDEITGELRWTKMSGRCRAGMVAGSVHCRGYIELQCRGHKMLAHQAAWVLKTGEWPSHDIDHRNLNKRDNRWNNLRAATASQNAANSKVRPKNKTGFKGVVRLPSGNFGAFIRLKGRKTYLGTFPTAQDAHRAYCDAAQSQWGSYARAS